MAALSEVKAELGKLVDWFRTEAHSVLSGAGLPAELANLVEKFRSNAHEIVATVEDQAKTDAATVAGQVGQDVSTVVGDVAVDTSTPPAAGQDAPTAG